MLTGLITVLHGTYRSDLDHTVGGTCLTLTALTTIALVFIRKWITDTSDERRILAAAQRSAEAERARYFAAQAALENEQGRLRQDITAERHANAVRLKTEREALANEFEAKRGELAAESMEVAVRLVCGKKLDPRQIATAKLIQFPQNLPHQQRDRSREHGEVAP
ncbi:hypothetical protein ABZT03_43025 [Streptomyces sp. NPDC005574]|uniref:hypothetical protein n=1 Tax=Streptomyces sp. NPDC005574 TaxID=3156891 RepID=UPI0033A5FE62